MANQDAQHYRWHHQCARLDTEKRRQQRLQGMEFGNRSNKSSKLIFVACCVCLQAPSLGQWLPTQHVPPGGTLQACQGTANKWCSVSAITGQLHSLVVFWLVPIYGCVAVPLAPPAMCCNKVPAPSCDVGRYHCSSCLYNKTRTSQGHAYCVAKTCTERQHNK